MPNDDLDPINSPNDTQLDQAVRLACAFVANGDIRLERGKTKNVHTCDHLEELIVDLYVMLGRAGTRVLNYELEASEMPPPATRAKPTA